MPSNSIETKTHKNSFCLDAASSSCTVRPSPLRCCAIAASFELTSTSHHRRLGSSGRQGLSRWWESTLKDFPFSRGSSVKRGRIKTEEVAPAQHQEDIKKQWQQGSSGEDGITNTKGGAGVALIPQREECNHLRLPDSEFVVWFQRHKLDWVTELDAVVIQGPRRQDPHHSSSEVFHPRSLSFGGARASSSSSRLERLESCTASIAEVANAAGGLRCYLATSINWPCGCSSNSLAQTQQCSPSSCTWTQEAPCGPSRIWFYEPSPLQPKASSYLLAAWRPLLEVKKRIHPFSKVCERSATATRTQRGPQNSSVRHAHHSRPSATSDGCQAKPIVNPPLGISKWAVGTDIVSRRP